MLAKTIKAGMTADDGSTAAAGAAGAAGKDTAAIMAALKGKIGDLMKGADRATTASDAASKYMADMDPSKMMDLIKDKMGGHIDDLMK